MKHLNNTSGSFHFTEAMESSIRRFTQVIENDPSLIKPVRGRDEKAVTIFHAAGFDLYPTVRNTTLLFDFVTGCFYKIVHPLNIRKRLFFAFLNRPREIYNLSAYLISKGIIVPSVIAYGSLRQGGKIFYCMTKVEGTSIYDIVIRQGKRLTDETWLKVIGEVSKMHALGYWLGDAHLSHIFLSNAQVNGFIDIDGLRKVSVRKLRCFAKDLAGLFHREAGLSEVQKGALVKYYLECMELKDFEKSFWEFLRYYGEKRWKAPA